MTQSIPLGKAAVALVDDADYDHLKSIAWFVNKDRYAVGFVPTNSRFQLTYMHRLILNAQTGELVDHINGNTLDNRRENLRLVTSLQNHHNRGLSSLSTTGLKGVGWHKHAGKYQARIGYKGLRCHLGFFDDPETAALAYDFAARTLLGAFGRLNYSDKIAPQPVASSVVQRLKKRGLLALVETAS
jgi:hypothetical protein